MRDDASRRALRATSRLAGLTRGSPGPRSPPAAPPRAFVRYGSRLVADALEWGFETEYRTVLSEAMKGGKGAGEARPPGEDALDAHMAAMSGGGV